MKLESIQVPIKNHVLADYWSPNTAIHQFFEYEYNDQAFEKRAEHLARNSRDQKELTTIIRQFMEPLGLSKKANEHLEQLEQGAMVIVGGQQAGILTGPLYSVHKAISVIALAKEQSTKLQQPVIPVFWIAGEDHDLEEINHTYTVHGELLKKRAYGERSRRKTMASATTLNKESMTQLINTIIRDIGETEYTETLIKQLVDALNNSETFTDFFACLMNQLFKEEGLLLIDAANFQFRQFEHKYFAQIIQSNEEIARVVTEKEQELECAGYGKPILATYEAANLFYVEDGERHLLERKNDLFVNLAANLKFTQEELLEVAHNHPERLSNNVVTRPLMQEMTLPVLAFVGGPGELAYWATLKNAFSVLDLQMPIFAPRLHITIVTRHVEQLLREHQLTVTDVWEGKALHLKERFIADVQDSEAKRQIQAMQQLLVEKYEELASYLEKQHLQLDKILEKNQENHAKQFDYLQQKIEQTVLGKHETTIRKFMTLQNELYPNDGFQERSFNPYQYFNEFGPMLITEMLKQNYSIGKHHYLLYL
ncbi:bacillithiol biosynthesis cysteine-adding enzyme BshC [Lysinibacillus sp. OL1_EC]|uniref:bacillithiol biosynthesis cysteine-adding enzyme BshC n=1 Tax=unclassified Lysinibacillus TaxID=2636778 RepID=UPI00103BF14F|nr:MULTISPECIES: bacillithiol biosynthesis cysteine-adding enzyme BshC [unclassified Lysinibacillus]MCM0625700.1 bacillithiol biosynthesis cysteine-adding enzyme BshC [Lysinibacillus sp. OL1_EC]MCS5502306.1 bacillithiol biosynthesis cysteine-adding enzyme BshC [Lysinibacillus sp. A4]TBV86467.1 bacillithiol biosynthesis cysteine-adding enzyme BshC [Lysinibacillus sp. OL1]UKJ46260.1 bacillithiol biosynthesis cysteine-adding enzyme BshC [Lysinibacillus sp. ACHW1.5]WGT40812.1 bacillithiol biosynth